VCGNAKSLMPVWSNENGGPLNYAQIDDIIAFLRATNDHTYTVRDPSSNEPAVDPVTGKEKTFTGWVDPTYKPAPGATPFPDCWTNAFANTGSSSPAASVAPGTTTLTLSATNTAFDETKLTAPADKAFAIAFTNNDAGTSHNVEIKNPDGSDAFKGTIFAGVATQTYSVPALKAVTYAYNCTVHPTMTGTITVK
jgi:plastocyanin